nr:hypothetical protein [Tanacetum cinerariifolium]
MGEIVAEDKGYQVRIRGVCCGVERDSRPRASFDNSGLLLMRRMLSCPHLPLPFGYDGSLYKHPRSTSGGILRETLLSSQFRMRTPSIFNGDISLNFFTHFILSDLFLIPWEMTSHELPLSMCTWPTSLLKVLAFMMTGAEELLPFVIGGNVISLPSKVKEIPRKEQNRIKTEQKREAWRSQEKSEAVTVD